MKHIWWHITASEFNYVELSRSVLCCVMQCDTIKSVNQALQVLARVVGYIGQGQGQSSAGLYRAKGWASWKEQNRAAHAYLNHVSQIYIVTLRLPYDGLMTTIQYDFYDCHVDLITSVNISSSAHKTSVICENLIYVRQTTEQYGSSIICDWGIRNTIQQSLSQHSSGHPRYGTGTWTYTITFLTAVQHWKQAPSWELTHYGQNKYCINKQTKEEKISSL